MPDKTNLEPETRVPDLVQLCHPYQPSVSVRLDTAGGRTSPPIELRRLRDAGRGTPEAGAGHAREKPAGSASARVRASLSLSLSEKVALKGWCCRWKRSWTPPDRARQTDRQRDGTVVFAGFRRDHGHGECREVEWSGVGTAHEPSTKPTATPAHHRSNRKNALVLSLSPSSFDFTYAFLFSILLTVRCLLYRPATGCCAV